MTHFTCCAVTLPGGAVDTPGRRAFAWASVASIVPTDHRRGAALFLRMSHPTVLDRRICRPHDGGLHMTAEVDMQFAVLIYQDWTWIDGLRENPVSETEAAEIGKEYAEIAATPGFQQNIPLGHPRDATTVRVQDGKTITADGTVGGPKATAGSVYVFE